MNLQKLYIDVEVEGLETLERLVEEMKEVEKETTVFECQLSEEIKFKGTKSDFAVFVDGVSHLFRVANLIR